MSNPTICLDKLYCPITREIFYEPVVASDGQVYELDAISHHILTHANSPVTRKPIDKKFYPCFLIKSLISDYLAANPEKIDEQYKISNNFEYNYAKVKSYLNAGNYDMLLNYVNYSWHLLEQAIIPLSATKKIDLMQNYEVINHVITNINTNTQEDQTKLGLFTLAIEYATTNVIDKMVLSCAITIDVPLLKIILTKGSVSNIKHIIENNIDTINTLYLDDCKFVHVICWAASCEIIKLAFDKLSLDLELEAIDKQRPFHIICKKHSKNLGMIQHMVNLGVNIHAIDSKLYTPFLYVCQYGSSDVIRYFMKLPNVDLEAKCSEQWSPIHFICRFHTTDLSLLKQLVGKGVNLEVETQYKYRPIHILCTGSNIKNIMHLVNIGVDLEKENNDGMKPVDLICQRRTLETIREFLKNDRVEVTNSAKLIGLIKCNKQLTTYGKSIAIELINAKVR